MWDWWWCQSLENTIIHLGLIIHNASFYYWLINMTAKWPSMPGWIGKNSTSSPPHENTAGRMWCWHPPASTAFPPLQRRQAAQGLQGAEMPRHAHIGAEWYPGLHRPPACPAELPVYAKDNWPNGLSLPRRLHMEWGGWKIAFVRILIRCPRHHLNLNCEGQGFCKVSFEVFNMQPRHKVLRQQHEGSNDGL